MNSHLMFTLLLYTIAFGRVTPCAASTEDRRPALGAALDSLRQVYGFPGATAAYALPDGSVETAATGLADVEADIPMTCESRMLAASIGKMFVGATAAALAREGALSLDDPVAKWLGDRSWFERLPNADSITVRHLLTHTSGIGNHVESPAFAEAFREVAQNPDSTLAPEGLVAFVLDQPPLFSPGHGWRYSDTGYLLVGMIIEKATGRSYYEEVTERFLRPVGLEHTTPSNRRELPGLAAGYVSPENPFGLPALPAKTTIAPGVMAWNPAVEWTGGGLASTSRDLAVWAKALFEGPLGDAVLASAPIRPEVPGLGYGLGVAIHPGGDQGPSYGHAGWIPGYCSSLRYYADHGVAVAFQINTDVGIADHSTPVMEAMERRLAQIAQRAAGQ